MIDNDLGGPWPAVELLPASTWTEARNGGAPQTPGFLLNEARACEPAQLLGQRTAALEAAAAITGPTDALWGQVAAEEVIDIARANQLDAAEIRARELLPGPLDDIARARVLEALGRVQVWRGDAQSAAAGAATLDEAADRYRRIGSREWAGFALFWAGNTVHFQRGDFAGAEKLMTAALAELVPASPRRAGVFTFLADVYEATGSWPAWESCLAEAESVAPPDDLRARAYIAWARARGASTRRDAVATARHLAEVERQRGDWFSVNTGATFLGDAAVLSARVGDTDSAATYLRRAVEMDPHDEFVLMAEAELLARSGDPEQALQALRGLGRAPWLELRLLWRFTLLSAWASLRAGRLDDAVRLASRAFQQGDAIGGSAIVRTGEPELTDLLAPLAARAGSEHAVALLAPTTGLQLRLLGGSALVRGTQPVPFPTGTQGALVQLLALHDAGLDVEQVVDALWPDIEVAAGRRQLRDILSRLRARTGELVVRRGPRLFLTDVWVDVRAFRVAADRALADRREGSVLGALALWAGTPLPAYPYASWAAEARAHLVHRHLHLLDLAADLSQDHPDRAATYLETAIEAAPDETNRYETLAALLDAHGRPAAAARWRRSAREHE